MTAVLNFTFSIHIFGNCRNELVQKQLNTENRVDEKSVGSFEKNICICSLFQIMTLFLDAFEQYHKETLSEALKSWLFTKPSFQN